MIASPYPARIADLDPADLIRVKCSVCGHDNLIQPASLADGVRLGPDSRITDLAPRLRCRECDIKGRAVVSIQRCKSNASLLARHNLDRLDEDEVENPMGSGDTVFEPATIASTIIPDLVDHIATKAVFSKPRSQQRLLGQHFTPETISLFMAALFPQLPKEIRLLDPGAGKGALTEAFVRRWRYEGDSGSIRAHLYEFDPAMFDELRKLAGELNQSGAVAEIFEGDFIKEAAAMLRLRSGPRYTHAILNPPYKKINTGSDHRGFLRAIGLETVNLYTGFLGLVIDLMENGGEVVAIIPRSFCNGPYYKPFRRFMFARVAIRHIHLFATRNKIFKGDRVLQENIIVHLTRGAEQGDVTISTSTDDSFCDYNEASYPFSYIVFPEDTEQFIHIPTAGANAKPLVNRTFGYRLDELGISVSTGPVVDFRLRTELCGDPEPGAVPLLYPGHFTREGLQWPKPGMRKPNAIRFNTQTIKWLFPAGFYAVVRRFSSKEERRRVVANVVDHPAVLEAKMIGFENHLNVLHDQRGPLSEELARGLAVYLNTTRIDQFFRQFNGHTQVNATDLRKLLYPSREVLTKLGSWAKQNRSASQEAIDEQVAELHGTSEH
jgi:adenine-specific DNA-methyltransferase